MLAQEVTVNNFLRENKNKPNVMGITKYKVSDEITAVNICNDEYFMWIKKKKKEVVE